MSIQEARRVEFEAKGYTPFSELPLGTEAKVMYSGAFVVYRSHVNKQGLTEVDVTDFIGTTDFAGSVGVVVEVPVFREKGKTFRVFKVEIPGGIEVFCNPIPSQRIGFQIVIEKDN